jgi:hypothetical protein
VNVWFVGAFKPNLRCGSISSLRVSRTNFSARNVINGVSRHPVLADIVGGVDSISGGFSKLILRH